MRRVGHGFQRSNMSTEEGVNQQREWHVSRPRDGGIEKLAIEVKRASEEEA